MLMIIESVCGRTRSAIAKASVAAVFLAVSFLHRPAMSLGGASVRLPLCRSHRLRQWFWPAMGCGGKSHKISVSAPMFAMMPYEDSRSCKSRHRFTDFPTDCGVALHQTPFLPHERRCLRRFGPNRIRETMFSDTMPICCNMDFCCFGF